MVPPSYVCWYINPINYSYIMYYHVISTINRRIQPLIRQLNAIERRPFVMDPPSCTIPIVPKIFAVNAAAWGAWCTWRMPIVVEHFAETRAHIDGAAHDDAPGVVVPENRKDH